MTADIFSDVLLNYGDSKTINADGVDYLYCYDTSYAMGILLGILVPHYNSGVYTIRPIESRDAGGSDPWALMPPEKIIGPEKELIINAGQTFASKLPSFGFIGNKRYVGLVIESTGITGGDGALIVGTVAAKLGYLNVQSAWQAIENL